jgi:hypothetical protein
MEDLYQAFLHHVFDHPEGDEAWFWNIDAPDFDASPATLARLAAMVFRRSGSDLCGFSDRQVNDGLMYLLDSACSDIVFVIRDGDFPLDLKLDLIRSMRRLYADCFAKRCPEVLCHLSERSDSALSYICYMLWDVTPFFYWPGAGQDEVHAEIVKLLDEVLYLDNQACVESALHGLGHVHSHASEAVEDAIDRFLATRADVPPKLQAYAKAARTGGVL